MNILGEELKRSKVLSDDFNIDDYKELVPMQPGDVPITYADTSALENNFNFNPNTSLRHGLCNFANWYKDFYKIEV